MAIQDVDIWRTANLVVKQHGKDAWFEAGGRADALLAKGDIDGYLVWKRVLKAVEWMTDESAGTSDQKGH